MPPDPAHSARPFAPWLQRLGAWRPWRPSAAKTQAHALRASFFNRRLLQDLQAGAGARQGSRALVREAVQALQVQRRPLR